MSTAPASTLKLNKTDRAKPPSTEDVHEAAGMIRYASGHNICTETMVSLMRSPVWGELARSLFNVKGCPVPTIPWTWAQNNASRLKLDERRLLEALDAARPLVETRPNEPDNERLVLRTTATLETESLDGMPITPIEWLEDGLLPLGKLVLIAGVGGLGKSLITLHIAARLTLGLSATGTQPDAQSDVTGPSDVLLIAAEDDPSDTQVPRLIAAGADLKRVRVVRGVRDPSGKVAAFSVANIPELRAELEANPNYRLVIVDPIASYIGRAKVDDHRNSELSCVLAPLAELAAEFRVTILLVAHLNKSTNGPAAGRIMGGSAYVNSTRASYIVAPDPDDPDVRIFEAIKFNLAEKPKPLAYKVRSLEPEEIQAIQDRPEFDGLNERQRTRVLRQLARVEFLGTTETTVETCLAGSGKRGRPTKLPECILWLHKHLAEHGPAKSDDVITAAADQFNKHLVWDAWKSIRETFGVKPVKDSGPGGSWHWPKLPNPE